MATIINTQTFSIGSVTPNGPLIDISQADFISVQIDGTFVGTITFRTGIESTGVVMNSFGMHRSSETTSTTDATNTTTTGLFSKPCTGLRYFQMIFTAYTSGTANITVVETILDK